MFFDSSCGVLHRHVPATEVDHATAGLAMHSIKWRSFELWGDCGHERMFRLIGSWDPEKFSQRVKRQANTRNAVRQASGLNDIRSKFELVNSVDYGQKL